MTKRCSHRTRSQDRVDLACYLGLKVLAGNQCHDLVAFAAPPIERKRRERDKEQCRRAQQAFDHDGHKFYSSERDEPCFSCNWPPTIADQPGVRE